MTMPGGCSPILPPPFRPRPENVSPRCNCLRRLACHGSSCPRTTKQSRICVLLAFQAIEKRGRQFVQQFQEDAVRPAKSNYILAITLHDMGGGSAFTTLYFSRMYLSVTKFSITMLRKL